MGNKSKEIKQKRLQIIDKNLNFIKAVEILEESNIEELEDVFLILKERMLELVNTNNKFNYESFNSFLVFMESFRRNHLSELDKDDSFKDYLK